MDQSELNAQLLLQEFYRIARSRHLLFRNLLSRYGVTLQQWHLLLHMKTREKVRVTDLSEMMLVSKPTASRMLNTLCEKGLARKKTDSKDRRLVYVEITSKGKKVVEDAHAKQREMVSKVLAQMDEDETQVFLRTMEKIADALVRVDQDA
ncbi:MAG: MarR family transcriptional regulator [Actinobacteria bacterium]|nr:MarR family transcriptional regulator [Actinomycetota bacterium]